MKKIYFLAFLFLCTFLTIGTNTAWGETAAVGDILWAENFAHFGTNTPSKAKTGTGTTIFGGATITYSQSSTSTKGYDANLAGGTAPELLLAKNNTTWTISGIPTGGATEMQLTFLSNKAAFGLTTTTQNLTISGKEKMWTIQVEEGKTAPETFDITLKNTATSNARIDNVSIVVVTAASSVSEKVSLVYNGNGSTAGTVPATVEYDKGATVTVAGNTGGLVKTGFDFAGWNTAANGSGTTYQEGNMFTINANTTLYALWTAQSNKLSTPTNLKTTDITSNSAKLSWDAVPHATKYTVTYAETNSSAIKVDVTSTTYVLSGLPSEATYLWTVKAVGDGTYEDSEESSTADFTTLPTPYTITWSTPTGTSTTEVTPDDKVVLPADPIAPYGCSEKVFVGWSETNIGTIGTDDAPAFITSQTIPNSDITYYAVFATKTTMGESQNIVFNVKNIAQENSWTSGTQYSSYTIAPITITYSGTTGNDGKYYTSDNSWRSYTGGSVVVSGGTISEVISTPEQTFTKQTDGTWKYTGTAKVNFTEFTIKTAVVSSTYTDYVTGCVDCTAPAEALALTLSQETANLGADGTAQISFSTTGGNGAIIDYAINPTIGANLDKTNKTITFSAIGTYTLTASQLYTTTDGTTYCGGKDKKTITVTNTPVLYFPTTPADPIEFGTVECGGNTPLENKQSISLRGYNLTSDVTVTVTGDYKIAGTESAELADYTTSLTLQKDAVSGLSTSVYVVSTPPMQSSSPTTGKVIFTTAGGNTLEVNLSTPDITCTEYTLTLNDRGTTISAGNYLAGASVPKPAAPTGVCTEPINYVFDGWATAEVAEGSTTYTKVPFPYTMPAANTTLYAVYRYEDNSINDFELVDEVISGRDYIIAADYDNKVYALTNSVNDNNKGVSTEVTCTGSNETGYIITTSDKNIIWHIEGNSTDGFTLYNAAIDKYLNMSLISANYSGLSLSQTGSTKYSFTLVDAQNSSEVTITGKNFSSAYNKMSFYNNVFQCYKDKSNYPIYIYSRRTDCYTTAPSCTPYIKGTDDITVTSANGVWVEAVTPLNITATNLDKNADGANVTITATSLTDGFTLKTPETNDSKSVELVTGYSNSTYNANLTVVYSPTADNIIEKGKIALRVCSTDGTTTYATDTIIVRGRSLPAEFVLAAQTASGWVALPADLGTSSTDAVKKPYTISVDDDAAPTKATLAPQSALYSAAMRSAANTIPTGLRFAAGGNYLQGSQSEGETKVWLSSNDNKQMQSWELHSSDLTDYFVRLRAAEEGRYLSYNATQGKIANYKQDSRLRILPVENTCVRYDAPNIRVHALISTSVTFVWEAIAGVTDYEYSLDNEQTWQTCSGSETLGTEVKWTLANLTSETKYTVYIRAKVADGKSNCSVSDSETFTTPTCDDVPVDLWVSPTANAATIMWSAKVPTATVKIYADEQGTKLVKETTNATTPCKITGLEQNTDYYYQVLADGSCASAIAHFKTESNEVSIVEWKKDALIVDLNTEVTDADEVSILVENQHTHGTNNQNIADDLFFSKYYEATGNVKLVAIYNGTKDTLPLTNVQIKIGNTTWDKTIQMSDYGKYKSAHIAPDEEIILWRKGTTSVDKEISDCVAGKMNIKIMNENDNVVFGGKASIGLFRADTLIDMIGAGTNDLPKEGTIKPSWGDDPGWLGSGYDIENPSTEIELSTNRCLLVRGNKVKSGRNAVLNNTTTFATFTKDEWLGRQVSKYKEDGTDDKGKESSCNGFAYVADFNYNDYYTTYDSIANLEIKGNRNEDGTYTIPVPKLDTMACTNLRLQLKKNGTIQATREEKVPIIIYTTTDTKNSTFFGGKLTDEICKTCDVVVRDNAQLLHTAGGKQQFRDMYVYTGSSLNIPENQTMSLDKVRMFATNDSVSYAIVNNSNDAAAAISVKEVSHVKRIDGRYWYPFSLPYDCNIADIVQLNGQPLGVYGTDWGIKYYDGQRRQSDGNSTTHYGEVSKYWEMMPKDGQLKAYTGYIIGLFVPAADEPLMKSVNFPPATESAYTENASSKTTPITNWSVNLNAEPRHRGWNFVGSPYISLFGSNNNTLGEGLYNTNVKMGWTDALGNQKDIDHIYVSIPNGGNTNTYTQALASGVTIYPFSAYFVQAIDPKNGQSPLNLTYSKSQRRLPKWAPARTAKTDALILTELDITDGALGDNTGVLVSNVYSAEYEIGDDLTKMYAAAQKPQLYTIDAHNDKMAYQALPDVLAHAIPLGIYVPQAGNYTLSLNRYVSRLEAAKAVYLLHNGAVVANLLLSDYTVAASAKGTISGYSLDIRRAPEVVTDIVPAAGDAPYIIARDGVLAIANLPADAVVQVYDVLGHRLLQTDTHAAGTLQVPVPQTGVYTVVITTADGQQVLKTLLR